MSLYEALLFVSKPLQVYGLHKNIKVIASSDIISGFGIAEITLARLLQRLDIFFCKSQAEQYDSTINSAFAKNIYESAIKISHSTTNNKKRKNNAL